MLLQMKTTCFHYLNFISRSPSCSSDYINKVNQIEKAMEEERKASKLEAEGDTGAKSVMEVLKSLNKKGQAILFYAGGMRMMAHILSDGIFIFLFSII